MARLLPFLLAIAALLPAIAHAEPADIDAAARGVVRVVIVETKGDTRIPIIHGTGFAVSPTRVVTNAHVVAEAMRGDDIAVMIVPNDGEKASGARIVATKPGADLALLQITGSLRLPPLTLSGRAPGGEGAVVAVGYPMNVDRAQGLRAGDIFSSQPPVKSRGFLSGERPSRQFDTLLHTAPIARGNSGGPLLDPCGRVLGVNSFGAESDGSDGDFYFAASDRELLPFLRANGVQPLVNAMACRSLADLNEEEAARQARETATARDAQQSRGIERRERRARISLEAEMAVQADREDRLAIAGLLVLAGFALAFLAYDRRRLAQLRMLLMPDDGAGSDTDHTALDPSAGGESDRIVPVMAGGAALCAVAGIAIFLTRPGLDAVDRRVAAAMAEDAAATGRQAGAADSPSGPLICTLVPERSRIVGEPAQSVAFEWAPGGCVNGRTQYGFAAGDWARVLVPDNEDTVSVNRYDPASRTFVNDRYLLARPAMDAARKARGAYEAPQCDAPGAATKLGEMQGSVTAALPSQPNERWVYTCAPADGRKNAAPSGG